MHFLQLAGFIWWLGAGKQRQSFIPELRLALLGGLLAVVLRLCLSGACHMSSSALSGYLSWGSSRNTSYLVSTLTNLCFSRGIWVEVGNTASHSKQLTWSACYAMLEIPFCSIEYSFVLWYEQNAPIYPSCPLFHLQHSRCGMVLTWEM